MELTEGRDYELDCLISPLVPTEKLPEILDGVRALIAKHDGEILSETNPRFVRLAYPVSKRVDNKSAAFREAHFCVILLRGQKEKTEELSADLKRQPQVIRFLLIKHSIVPVSRGRMRPIRAPLTTAPSSVIPATSGIPAPKIESQEQREAIDREIEELLAPLKEK